MVTDTWHYPRLVLAKHILALLESGLSSALTFFAPRRMGKTEFLRKDISPLAEKLGWQVFYFSFLDVGPKAKLEFTQSLIQFAVEIDSFAAPKRLLKQIDKISGEITGIKGSIQFKESKDISNNMKEVMKQLAKKGKILLLLDEVQILAQHSINTNFIAALRTSLDIHKDTIKVIFTGSSQEGLRRMFSESKAPFFHFGQNLPFPELDKGFTDHLSRMFEKVTGRKINPEKLWDIFQEMQKVPQLIRSLVERLALNPDFSIENAKTQLLAEIFNDREFIKTWEECTALERLLLQEISVDEKTFFSEKARQLFASKLGVAELPVSSVQSSLRVLLRKGVIGRQPDRQGYYIDDPSFKSWMYEHKIIKHL